MLGLLPASRKPVPLFFQSSLLVTTLLRIKVAQRLRGFDISFASRAQVAGRCGRALPKRLAGVSTNAPESAFRKILPDIGQLWALSQLINFRHRVRRFVSGSEPVASCRQRLLQETALAGWVLTIKCG